MFLIYAEKKNIHLPNAFLLKFGMLEYYHTIFLFSKVNISMNASQIYLSDNTVLKSC